MSNSFVEAFSFLADHPGVVVGKLGVHLEISVEAMVISVLIALPLGVVLGHLHRFSFLAINVSNVGRALPSLAVLAILLPYVGVGRTDLIIALVVLAVPPILTNAYVAIDQVDPGTVDAARGIGLTPAQVLAKVELPLAVPLIFAGVRTAAVFVVATATLGGIFGGGGLGEIINNRESYGLSGVIAACYVLIVLAFAVQLLFLAAERLLTPVAVRACRGPARPGMRRRNAPVVLTTSVVVEEESSPLADQGSVS